MIDKIVSKYSRKLSAKQIQQMRSLVKEGFAVHYIARKFNCRANAVHHHVFDLIPPRVLTPKCEKTSLSRSVLTVKDVKKIRALRIKQGESSLAISKSFGISHSSVLNIVKGRTFRWIPGKTLCGDIVPVKYKYVPKTDKTRGIVLGSKKLVKSGVLIRYAEKFNVKPSTVCKWVKMGKLHLEKKDLTIAGKAVNENW